MKLVSLAYTRGQRDYSTKDFEENPFPHGSRDRREWNNGWRDKQLADPLLDEDERNAGM